MIDACQSYPPDEDPDEPFPNCPEPYQITFEEPGNAFPSAWVGQASPWYKFWLYDHQHDYYDEGYSSDFENTLTFFFPDPEQDFEIDGEVAYDSNPDGDGAKYKFKITPDSDVYAGLYEGIIKIQEVDGVTLVGPPLKRKIWATVLRSPGEDDMTVGTHSRASSPVLVDWDNSGDLEYVFTTDKKIWAQDTDWGDAGKIHYPSYSGYYVGVPSIVGDNILLALNYTGPQNGDCMVIALDCSEDDGDEIPWETHLYGPAAGHPVPFDVSGGTYKTLVVCTGGEWDWWFQDPEWIAYPSCALNIIDDEGDIIAQSPPEPDPVYFGAPALMSLSGYTYAFVVRDEGGDGLTLEAWNLADVSSGAFKSVYLHVPDVYNLEPSLSPAIGKFGSNWVIYTPTYDKLYCHIFTTLGFTEKGVTGYPDEDYYDTKGQLAIGDINGDGLEDVVVPLHGAVCAYTGYTGDVDTTLQLIWSYEPGESPLLEFSSPSLIDCNGDHYLDVVTAANSIGETYRLLVIDGSPYNNHKRSNPVDRICWGFPITSENYSAHAICPVLSEYVDGDYYFLNIGMIFFGGNQADNIYDQINTKFKYHDEEYQPKPWFKAYYSLNNWNNTQISSPY
jgi:hypothetical protein